MNKYCYATLADNENYLKEAIALATSLRKSNSKYPLLLMIPVGTINKTLQDNIPDDLNIIIKEIPYFISNLNSSRFESICINKFAIFSFIEYDSICFLDADNLILKNLDHIFNEKLPLFPVKENDKEYGFNGNIMVIKPDLQIYSLIISLYMNIGFSNDEHCLNFLYEQQILPCRTFTDINCNFYLNHQGEYPKYWFSFDNFVNIKNYILNNPIEIIRLAVMNSKSQDNNRNLTFDPKPWIEETIKNGKEKYENI